MGQMKVPSAPKLYTSKYEKLKGVDFSCDLTEVDKYRTPTGLNMISDDGGNPIKRRGWRVVEDIQCGEIYKIIFHEDDETTFDRLKTYVIAENGIYAVVSSGGNYESLTIKEETITNAEYFLFDQKVFVIVNGNIYRLHGIEATSLEDEAYVPEVTISLNPDGTGGTSLDAVNILNKKRKYSFFGTATDKKYYLYPAESRADLKYRYILKEGIKVELLTTAGWIELDNGTDYTIPESTMVWGKNPDGTVSQIEVVEPYITFEETHEGSSTDGADNISITFTAYDCSGDEETYIAETETIDVTECKAEYITTTSNTVTASISNETTLRQKFFSLDTQTLVFTRQSSNWKYNGSNVTLSDYGIATSGTVTNGDKIKVSLLDNYDTDIDAIDYSVTFPQLSIIDRISLETLRSISLNVYSDIEIVNGEIHGVGEPESVNCYDLATAGSFATLSHGYVVHLGQWLNTDYVLPSGGITYPKVILTPNSADASKYDVAIEIGNTYVIENNEIKTVDNATVEYNTDVKVTVDISKFRAKNKTAPFTQTFTRVGANWKLGGANVNLADYGIVYPSSVTPTEGEIIAVTMKVYAQKGLYNENRIDLLKTNSCLTYGYESVDRVFVVGGVNKNRIYYSGVNEPMYFPDTNYLTVGHDSNGITGLHRISGYLAALKEDSSNESTVFLISGAYLNDTMYFKVEATSAGIGAIAPKTLATLNDEPLFLSRNGVYAIANYYTTTEKVIRNRSYRVDKKLTKEEGLEKACAISWRRYYILCVNSRCYVLDARNKSNDQRNNTDFLYECYYWENVPATVFATYNNELYFGTSDGKICKFNTDIPNRTAYCDNGTLTTKESGEYIMEDGDAIHCEWSTPLDGDDAPQYFKTLNKKGSMLTLLPQLRTSAKVTLIKNGDIKTELGIFYADIFDWEDIDFTRFTFNSNDTAQDDYFKKKIKKYKRLQIVVENDGLYEPFGILSIIKTYYVGNFAK